MAPLKCLICTRYVHKSNRQVQCLICSKLVHAECIGITNVSVHTYYCNHCLSDALPFIDECTDSEFFEQLGIPFNPLKNMSAQYMNLKLNLYDFDEHNFASCSDIDADINHFNMFNHINNSFDTPRSEPLPTS